MARKPATAKPRDQGSSPVEIARNLPCVTRLELAARSAGRCEFAGCNKFLLAHELTGEGGNFSDVAHIVAFSADGPRGDMDRPLDPHALDNLMLLCLACHKLIDTNHADYPVGKLRGFKRAHEERIRAVTEHGPEMRTWVIQLRGRIGGQPVDIPAHDVRSAIAPRYAPDETGAVIDLAHLRSEELGMTEAALHIIRRQIDMILSGGIDGPKPRHYSIFALATIPVLMAFGRELGDKVAADMYQKHRDQSWTWRKEAVPAQYTYERIQDGTDPACVALVLSLSGKVLPASLPADIDARFTIYEITLAGQEPNRQFLNLKEDLELFRRVYREVLSEIHLRHQGPRQLHVFPAVPAPVAIRCGTDLFPKVDPELVVYDNVGGTFQQCVTINSRPIS